MHAIHSLNKMSLGNFNECNILDRNSMKNDKGLTLYL